VVRITRPSLGKKAENNNPPLEVAATNFFNIRFYKRLSTVSESSLSQRQQSLYRLFQEKNTLTKQEVATILNVSQDTALRELNALIGLSLIVKSGVGKKTRYHINKN